MKLHFEPDLEHQMAAIEAVCDLFRENPGKYVVARLLDDVLAHS